MITSETPVFEKGYTSTLTGDITVFSDEACTQAAGSVPAGSAIEMKKATSFGEERNFITSVYIEGPGISGYIDLYSNGNNLNNFSGWA